MRKSEDYTNKIVGSLKCLEDAVMQNGHNRTLKIECLKCGRIFYLRPYQFKRGQHVCPPTYIGKTNSVLTCIEDLGQNLINDKKAHLLKVLCSRCGKESIVRSDRVASSAYSPQSCSHCVASLQKEIADVKYASTRNFRKRLHSIVGNAKARSIEMHLTTEQIKSIIKRPCYYCGEPDSNGIDRKDSSKDYTIDNCVPCCYICNRIKNKYSLDVFLDKISKIYNNLCIKSSTTISKESTLQANGSGSGEPLTDNAEGDDIVSTLQ